MNDTKIPIFNNGNYSALYISKYLLTIAKQKNIKISNLKLHKLLYFMQGFFYLETKEFLFNDDFEAWNHGPAIPEVYYYYKHHCSEPIVVKELVDINKVDLKISVLTDIILETFGKLSVWDLIETTQKTGPWKEFHNRNNCTIPKHKIATFFMGLK